jgi:ADP-ribose pyrophosphatase YjhB (NUDIX family)
MTWTTFAGAGALVVRDGGLLLVRQHRPYGVHWELPSGYYEPGESFEETAAREVLEETAIAVEIGALVCTMSWERDHDRRRNLLAYFAATPLDPGAEPRAQAEEEIEDAGYLDPLAMLDEIHPLHRVLLERWWHTRSGGFHVHADVDVLADGSQSYSFREGA